MRLSLITALSLSTLALSAPIHSKRDPSVLDDIKQGLKNLANSNATVSGVIGAIGQSIANPALTAARVQVVKGLSSTEKALSDIKSQAGATDNTGVTQLAAQAETGIDQAHQGVNKIGEAIVSGQKPAKSDQKDIAVGIKQALVAITGMNAAVTTPDDKLSTAIKQGESAVQGLSVGGEGVLSASGLTFADLGLPDDFETSSDTGADAADAAAAATATAAAATATAAADDATASATEAASATATDAADEDAGAADEDAGAADEDADAADEDAGAEDEDAGAADDATDATDEAADSDAAV